MAAARLSAKEAQRTGAFVTVYFRAISYCCKSDSSAQKRVGVANQSFSPLAKCNASISLTAPTTTVSMASGSSSSGFRGSVYSLYTTQDVVNMMDDVDEPMCENSDDDLGMDIHDSDDETRYISQHKHTKIHVKCLYIIVYMKLEKTTRYCAY